jgi:hypothetical protein
MKKQFLFFAALFYFVAASAQTPNGFVGLGNTNPKAKLHITSDSSGLLIPKYATLALANSQSLTKLNSADHNGLMIYVDEAANQGFWYYNGTAFVKVGGAAGGGFFKVNTTDPTQISYTSNTNYGKNFVVNADSTNYSGVSETKMYFAPSKAAFRAGQYTSKDNNLDTAGNYSVAFGRNNKVKGSYGFSHGVDNKVPSQFGMAIGAFNNSIANYSTAIGFGDSTVGEYSLAIGRDLTAKGNHSIALGNLSKALGYVSFASGYGDSATNTGSIAMGLNNKSKGQYAVSFGDSNFSSGDYSFTSGFLDSATNTGAIAMGNYSNAKGAYAIALGNGNTAGGNWALAVGSATKATGQFSTAMGSTTTASDSYAHAMGNQTIASGNTSTAMGQQTIASGQISLAMGQSTQASGLASTSMGAFSLAKADISSTFGLRTIAKSYAETAIGFFNDTLVTANATGNPLDSNRVFTVGTGLDNNNRKTAFVIQQNGNVGVGSRKPQSTLEVNGPIADNVTSFTAATATPNFIYTSTTSTLFVGGTVASTIFLPEPSSCKGRKVTVKKTSSSNVGMTFRTLLGANVEGSSAYTITASATLYSYMLQSDGTSWWVINKF